MNDIMNGLTHFLYSTNEQDANFRAVVLLGLTMAVCFPLAAYICWRINLWFRRKEFDYITRRNDDR
jgi:hypothetical protein